MALEEMASCRNEQDIYLSTKVKIKDHKNGSSYNVLNEASRHFLNIWNVWKINARFNVNSLNASLKPCKRFWCIRNEPDILILNNPLSIFLSNKLIQ